MIKIDQDQENVLVKVLRIIKRRLGLLHFWSLRTDWSTAPAAPAGKSQCCAWAGLRHRVNAKRSLEWPLIFKHGWKIRKLNRHLQASSGILWHLFICLSDISIQNPSIGRSSDYINGRFSIATYEYGRVSYFWRIWSMYEVPLFYKTRR